MSDHLELLSALTARAGRSVGEDAGGRPSRLFMTSYAAFLIESGAEIRWLLEPSLMEQAVVAVRRQAPDMPEPQQRLATRLLATLWASGAGAGLSLEDWARTAPELPGICLRLIRRMAGDEAERAAEVDGVSGGDGTPGLDVAPGVEGLPGVARTTGAERASGMEESSGAEGAAGFEGPEGRSGSEGMSGNGLKG